MPWFQKYNSYREPSLVAPSISRRILNIHIYIYMYTCMQYVPVSGPFPSLQQRLISWNPNMWINQSLPIYIMPSIFFFPNQWKQTNLSIVMYAAALFLTSASPARCRGLAGNCCVSSLSQFASLTPWLLSTIVTYLASSRSRTLRRLESPAKGNSEKHVRVNLQKRSRPCAAAVSHKAIALI
jgi:uncharacterized membrane protein